MLVYLKGVNVNLKIDKDEVFTALAVLGVFVAVMAVIKIFVEILA